MPVRLGDASPSSFRFGDATPTRLYFADNLVWSSFTFSFVDEFSIDVPTGMGAAWTKVSGGYNASVTSGHVNIVVADWNTGLQIATYRPTGIVAPQDDVAVRFNVELPSPYAAAGDAETGVFLRTTDDNIFNYGVGVKLYNTTCRIFTKINGTETAETTAVAYPYGTPLEFRAVGRVFTLIRLDTMATVTSWTDSTSKTGMGSSYRAFKTFVSAIYPAFSSQFSSPGLARFEAKLP